jgi:hypothetical protein
VGKQDAGEPNVGRAPNVIHRQMARTQAILGDNRETISLQRSSAPSTGDKGSRGRRRIAGATILDDAGTAR